MENTINLPGIVKIPKSIIPGSATLEEINRPVHRGSIVIVLASPLPSHPSYAPFVEYLKSLKLAGIIDLKTVVVPTQKTEKYYANIDNEIVQIKITDTVAPEEMFAEAISLDELNEELELRNQDAITIFGTAQNVSTQVVTEPYEVQFVFKYDNDKDRAMYLKREVTLDMPAQTFYYSTPEFDASIQRRCAALIMCVPNIEITDAHMAALVDDWKNNLNSWRSETAEWNGIYRYAKNIVYGSDSYTPFTLEKPLFVAQANDIHRTIKRELTKKFNIAKNKIRTALLSPGINVDKILIASPRDLIRGLQVAVESLPGIDKLPEPTHVFAKAKNQEELIELRADLNELLMLHVSASEIIESVRKNYARFITPVPKQNALFDSAISKQSQAERYIRAIQKKYRETGGLSSPELNMEERLRVGASIITIDLIANDISSIEVENKRRNVVESLRTAKHKAETLRISEQDVFTFVLGLGRSAESGNENDLKKIDIADEIFDGRIAGLIDTALRVAAKQVASVELRTHNGTVMVTPTSQLAIKFLSEVANISAPIQAVQEVRDTGKSQVQNGDVKYLKVVRPFDSENNPPSSEIGR
jgi:hypothetical protein